MGDPKYTSVQLLMGFWVSNTVGDTCVLSSPFFLWQPRHYPHQGGVRALGGWGNGIDPLYAAVQFVSKIFLTQRPRWECWMRLYPLPPLLSCTPSVSGSDVQYMYCTVTAISTDTQSEQWECMELLYQDSRPPNWWVSVWAATPAAHNRLVPAGAVLASHIIHMRGVRHLLLWDLSCFLWTSGEFISLLHTKKYQLLYFSNLGRKEICWDIAKCEKSVIIKGAWPL